jgi:HEAT repeat protein
MTDSDTPTLKEQILNAYNRRLAREELASVATELIIPLLHSDNFHLREAAIFALGYTEKQQPGTRHAAFEPLCAVMLNDKYKHVRLTALGAVRYFMNDDPVPALVQTLITDDDNRFYALRELKKRNRASVIEHLKTALERETLKARFRAARHLVEMDDRVQYAGKLDHPDPNIRLLSVFSALSDDANVNHFNPPPEGYLDEAVRQQLELHYVTESDGVVRAACIDVLARSEYLPMVSPFLLAMSDAEPMVRQFAIGGLMDRSDRLAGMPDSEAVIIRALADADSRVRIVAANTIARMNLKAAVPALMTLLEDEGEGRERAVDVLGSLQATEAVPVLLHMVKAGDAVSDACCAALRKINDRSAVLPLLDMIQNREQSRRGNIAFTLGELADIRAVPVLLEILADDTDDQVVRARAAYALALINPPEIFETLVNMLAHTQVEHLRYFIARALHVLRDSRAESYLIGLLTDDSNSVQVASVEALGDVGSAGAISHVQKLLQDSQQRNSAYVFTAAGAALKKLMLKYNMDA